MINLAELMQKAREARDSNDDKLSLRNVEQAWFDLASFRSVASPSTILALCEIAVAAIQVNDSARHKGEGHCEIPTSVVMELGDKLRAFLATKRGEE